MVKNSEQKKKTAEQLAAALEQLRRPGRCWDDSLSSAFFAFLLYADEETQSVSS